LIAVAGPPTTGDEPPSSDADSPSVEPTPDPSEPTAQLPGAALLREAEAAAAARGRAMVDEARAVRKRMLDDLERRRQQLLQELERVRAALDDLAHGLAEPLARRVEPEPSSPSAEPDPGGGEPRADDVFARLREDRDGGEPAPPEPVAPPPSEPPDAGPDLDDEATRPASEPEPEAPAPTAAATRDDATRRRRDEVLAPLTESVLRASKRLLQDEQNELLDTVRRLRGRADPARLLPDPEKQQTTWSAVLAPTIDEAYTVGRALTGRRRRPTAAPARLVSELAASLVTPLRERLVAVISAVVAEGPYEPASELQAALAPAISARYREWRTRDLEGLLGDLLAAAYARGAFDATPSGTTLRWVPAEVGQCPDADDNALEPTVKGQHFPTGQPYPPAHPGCRCLVVPSDGGSDNTPV
jgi:hypothetical protein